MLPYLGTSSSPFQIFKWRISSSPTSHPTIHWSSIVISFPTALLQPYVRTLDIVCNWIGWMVHGPRDFTFFVFTPFCYILIDQKRSDRELEVTDRFCYNVDSENLSHCIHCITDIMELFPVRLRDPSVQMRSSGWSYELITSLTLVTETLLTYEAPFLPPHSRNGSSVNPSHFPRLHTMERA